MNWQLWVFGAFIILFYILVCIRLRQYTTTKTTWPPAPPKPIDPNYICQHAIHKISCHICLNVNTSMNTPNKKTKLNPINFTDENEKSE